MLQTLPGELLLLIESYCEDYDAISLSRVCDAVYQDLRSQSLRRRIRLVMNHLNYAKTHVLRTMGSAPYPLWSVMEAKERAAQKRPVDRLDIDLVNRFLYTSSWYMHPDQELIQNIDLARVHLKILMSRGWEDVQRVVKSFLRGRVPHMWAPHTNAVQFSKLAVYLCGDLAKDYVLNHKLYSQCMVRRPDQHALYATLARDWLLVPMDLSLPYTCRVDALIRKVGKEHCV